ncbi:hypothetical protein [Deinococcus aerophilus]|uniref:Uncharacterized protein n=1 Tax=Deinococcus aerophilus TaxID=522488 RepID=A0ABQ2GST9_9DEIO|nr:hypothetical protein [Deinococcus aerophilus]GGM11623.1 hypothetical protein GCM10010841_20220 [Deinococcus aerophilus]
MKRPLLLAVLGSLALASCNRMAAPDVSGTTKTAPFMAMLTSVDADKSSAGTPSTWT